MMRIVLAVVLLATPSVAVAGASPPDAALLARARAFLDARQAFDQSAMATMMAPDYVEVSPIGDVDTRDEVIGFYASDKKVTAPPMTVTESIAHVAGTLGTITLRVSYAVPGKDGTVQNRAMRAGLVARRDGRDWRFVFVQLTPVRG